MNGPMRRAWSRPELVVLVRGGPEEAALAACKDTLQAGSFNTHGDCMYSGAACLNGCRSPIAS